MFNPLKYIQFKLIQAFFPVCLLLQSISQTLKSHSFTLQLSSTFSDHLCEVVEED